MVLYHFCKERPLPGLKNAVVPTEELKVRGNFGAGASRIGVVPARALRVERKFWGQRLPDHPAVPPGAAGKPEQPGYTGEGGGPRGESFGSVRGGKEG